MPFFIKRLKQVNEWTDKHGVVRTNTKALNFKRDELVEIIANAPSRIFEVTTSHADQVLRRGTGYQEVYDDIISEGRKLAESLEATADSGEEQADIAFTISDAQPVASGPEGARSDTVPAAGSEAVVERSGSPVQGGTPAAPNTVKGRGGKRRVQKLSDGASTLKRPAGKS